jgi:hypothetical protein
LRGGTDRTALIFRRAAQKPLWLRLMLGPAGRRGVLIAIDGTQADAAMPVVNSFVFDVG